MKKLRIKKAIIATVLCLSMLSSSAITVLADETTPSETVEETTTIEDVVEETEVSEEIVEETEPETDEQIETTVSEETEASETTEEVIESEVTDVQEYDASLTVNATDVTLYFLSDGDKQFISMPSSVKTSFQLSVSNAQGTVRYRSSNTSVVDVSSTGEITPHVTTWYWKNGFGTTTPTEGATVEHSYNEGTATITIFDGTSTKTVNVTVKNYAIEYVDNLKKSIVKNIITSSMTEAKKLETITTYVAENYNYSVSYSSANAMLLTGGGDCWASTGLIIDLCKLCGIEAYVRYAANDSLAGGGHRNVIAKCDGKMYIADAGYTGNKPRYHAFYETTGFLLVGNNVKQCDYLGTTINIPSNNSSYTITDIGSNGSNVLYYNNYRDKITTINIPSTVTYISEVAFAGCPAVTAINVDSKNTTYKSVNGVVYSKDGTKLVMVPAGLSSCKIASGVTEISDYAFYTNGKITSITIPSTVKTIGEGSFGNCTNVNRIVVPSSVSTIGDFAFYSGVKNVVILNKNATIGNNIVSPSTTAYTIYGYKGSTAEAYANANKNTFVAIDSNKQYMVNASSISTLYDINGNVVDYTGEYTYDGIKYLLVNGKTTNEATLAKIDGVWRYVEHGQFSNATTLVKYSNSWWYVKDGKLCYDETLVKYNNGWWYVKDGKICKDETLVKYNNAWWYVKDGKLCKDETLVKYNNAWWYVKDGKLCKTENFVKYSNSYWYCRDGKMQSSVSGIITINGVTKTVSKGKVV